MGFTVLAFSCSQFGWREFSSAAEIERFCRVSYQIDFPVHKTVKVNGPDAHPIFDILKSEAPGLLGTTSIKGNFTKFLVDRDGRVLQRFGPMSSGATIAPVIAERLGLSIGALAATS